MSNNNLELWNRFCVTDTKFTKEATKGAYKFTSIAPMYQKKLMTDALGPQGIAWGVEIGSESWEYKEIGETILLIYKAVLFYNFKGDLGRLTIAATEKLAYKTQGANGYLKIDDEADKKVKTAALTKGLSELGVTADVHMGLHMEHEYQEYASAKLRVESGDDDQIRAANDDFKAWFDSQVKTLGLSTSEGVVNRIMRVLEPSVRDKLTVLKATPQKRTAVINRLFAAADAAKEAIKNKDAK